MHWNEKDYSHLITNLFPSIWNWIKSLSTRYQNRVYEKAVEKSILETASTLPSRAEYNVLDQLQKEYEQGKITVKDSVTTEEYYARVNAEIQRLAKEQADRLGKGTQVWGGFKFEVEDTTGIYPKEK